jgi:hypothetical protein
MSNTTIGPSTKKETVYSGPTQQSKQGTVYNGPAPSSGTVYDGPAMKPNGGGTVYGGPAPAGTLPAGGTVYTPTRLAANQQPVTPTHDPAARKGGNIFFAIAIFSAINTALIIAGSSIVLGMGSTSSKMAVQGQINAIVMINVLVVGVFVLLGIFARQGSKAAFIIGMLLYGGDTVLLLASGDPSAHIAGIVVHAILLLGLFKSFTQLAG